MALITNLDAANDGFANTGYLTSLASFLRPDDTDDYASGDVIGDGAPAANAIVFPGCGRSGAIRRVSVNMEEADTVNMELWIFDEEPTNFQDNDAIALVSADLAKLVAVYELADTNKFLGDTAIIHYVTTNALGEGAPAPFATVGNNLFGLLVTRSIFTPVALSKYHIRLGIESKQT